MSEIFSGFRAVLHDYNDFWWYYVDSNNISNFYQVAPMPNGMYVNGERLERILFMDGSGKYYLFYTYYDQNLQKDLIKYADSTNQGLTWIWGHPIDTSNVCTDFFNACGMSDSLGVAHVVYVIDYLSRTSKQIRYSKYPFTDYITIGYTTTYSGRAPQPYMVIDLNDHIHVVWVSTYDPTSYSMIYREFDGTNWLDSVVLAPYGTTYCPANPTITIDGTNRLHVTWLYGTSAKIYLYYMYRDLPNGSWSDTEQVKLQSYYQIKFHFTMGLNGILHGAYSCDYPNNLGQIYGLRRENGVWIDEGLIVDNAGQTVNNKIPSLAVDKDGVTWMVFQQYHRGDQKNYIYYTYKDSTGWHIPSFLRVGEYCSTMMGKHFFKPAIPAINRAMSFIQFERNSMRVY